MANHASAKKRIRQTKRRTAVNRARRGTIRTQLRAVEEAIASGNKDAAQAAFDTHCQGRGLLTCRFTHVYPDGPAPYYSVVAWAPEGRQVETWDAIKAAVSDAIIRFGGTITHHHAVGRDHRPWHEQERGPLFTAALSSVKSTLDPAWVLNPGVLLEEPPG